MLSDLTNELVTAIQTCPHAQPCRACLEAVVHKRVLPWVDALQMVSDQFNSECHPTFRPILDTVRMVIAGKTGPHRSFLVADYMYLREHNQALFDALTVACSLLPTPANWNHKLGCICADCENDPKIKLCQEVLARGRHDGLNY